MDKLKQNQKGLAAITVTMIIFSIITLVTVGFATLMRREQRQALDQQLSTQAFYAAESGVNAARSYIDGSDPDDVNDVTDCNQTQTLFSDAERNIADNVSFSCVLLDTTPSELQKTLGTDESWVVKVESDSTPIQNIEISWELAGSDQFAEDEWSPTHLLPPSQNDDAPGTAWGAERTGLLRTMMIPDQAPGSTNRNALVTDTFHSILYPNRHDNPDSERIYPSPWGSGSSTPTTGEQAIFMDGNCHADNGPYKCKTNISTINRQSFYLRIKPIYAGATVNVRAFNGNTQLALRNGQAQIDATGKAADVVRRIRVHVPINRASYLYPEYALETFNTLCKRFQAQPEDISSDLDTITSVSSRPLTANQEAACAIESFTGP